MTQDQLNDENSAAGHPSGVNSAERLEALLSGPSLKDFSAAASCSCSCHPRPASTSLHNSGVSCPCQMAPQERRDAMQTFFEEYKDLHRELEYQHRSERIKAEALALSLNCTLMHFGGSAPFVISGIVDSHGFYLRERHDMYSIAVSQESGFSQDLWLSDNSVSVASIASSSIDDLLTDDSFDSLKALSTAVSAVRLYVLRLYCKHENAGRFCPQCGIDTEEIDARGTL